MAVGSENDEVIVPWNSSHFDFYDTDDEVVISFHDTELYKEDKLGLK